MPPQINNDTSSYWDYFYDPSKIWTDISTAASEYKSTVVEAVSTLGPLIIDNVIFYGSAFIDGIIIGRLGSAVLAASSFISNIKQFTVLSFSATFVALQPLIAINATTPEESNNISRLIYASFFLVGAYTLLSASLLSLAPVALKAAAESGYALVGDYFHYFIAGLLAKFTVPVINQFLLSTGCATKMIPLSLFRTGLEVGLTYALANHLNMATKGWGIATAAQPWITVLLTLGIARYYRKAWQHVKKYRLNHPPKINGDYWADVKRILKIGFPACLQTMVSIGAVLMGSFFAGRLGTAALASYQVGSSVSYWGIMFLDPLTSMLSVLLPTYANNPLVQHKLIVTSAIICGLSSVLLTTLPVLLSDKVVDLYVKNNDENYAAIQSTCQHVIPIMALTAPIYGTKAIFTGMLRSKKITLSPMIAELLGTFSASTILSAIAVFAMNKGPAYIAGSQMLGMLMSAIIIGVQAKYPEVTFNNCCYSLFSNQRRYTVLPRADQEDTYNANNHSDSSPSNSLDIIMEADVTGRALNSHL